MLDLIIESKETATSIYLISEANVENWLKDQPSHIRVWLQQVGFSAKVGSLGIIPSTDGKIDSVVFVIPRNPTLWDYAALSENLPKGRYSVPVDLTSDQATELTLAWALAGYRFDRYQNRPDNNGMASLLWPMTSRRDEVTRIAEAVFLVRDLINTPATDLGPDGLAQAADSLCLKHGANNTITVGDDLITNNFPAIHAVGRAHDRAPRLIDFTWGEPDAPRVTLVGKGVCFDTGGLNIKPAIGMKFMKKDMGGAAHTLGAAHAIMSAALPIRLRVLIPAVENSIAGNAMRPGDVVNTRKGLTIEIGNTDAEGRVILADALAEASTEKPEMIIDFATLTGAARVALGPELPALFCNDDDLANGLINAGNMVTDPLWRMPLWPNYDKQIDGRVADLNNAPDGNYGGAITAALFLQRFVGKTIPWAHIDLMAWNTTKKPGRPEGGEAMGMRALLKYLESRYKK